MIQNALTEADIIINEHGEEVINQNRLETYEDDEDDSSDGDIKEPLALVTKQDKITLELPPASTVYFVGDTPESDIRFANSHDASWHSILVKTGVYKDGTVPKYAPKHLCENVLEAVNYAIEREHEKELLEWNETADTNDSDDKSLRVNFADLVMTPFDKSEKQSTSSLSGKPTTSKPAASQTKAAHEHEAIEVPVVLSEQIERIKDIGINK